MSGIPAGAGSLLGKRLGKYEILALLALGGTAEIYLARIGGAAGFEKYVVVKCLHDHLADDAEFVKMFLDEARLAAQLDHSNIVQTMELGEHENRYYMVMEFLAGLSLAMVVRRAQERLPGGRFPVQLSLNMIAQSCAGLHYAHERLLNGKPLNIVHRDISPQNLVVSFEGVVKLVDFGIAKAEHRETRTQSGTIKGKFAYMSPEQCVAHNVDRRTDVFALGVIAWELITSRRLFKKASAYETYQAVIECAVEPPSHAATDLDPALDPIIMRSLAKDKEHRYPTAEAFGDAILGYLHHRGFGSGPGDVSRFFDTAFSQDIEEHGARMRELISGRAPDASPNWGEDEEKPAEVAEGQDKSIMLGADDLEAMEPSAAASLSSVIGQLGGGGGGDDDGPAERTRIEANPLEKISELEGEVRKSAPNMKTVALPASGAAPLPGLTPASPKPGATPPPARSSGKFPEAANLPTMIAEPEPDSGPVVAPELAKTELAGQPIDTPLPPSDANARTVLGMSAPTPDQIARAVAGMTPPPQVQRPQTGQNPQVPRPQSGMGPSPEVPPGQRGSGMGPAQGQGQGPSSGQAPTMIAGISPGTGQGMGPGSGSGPNMGPGSGPNMGPGSGGGPPGGPNANTPPIGPGGYPVMNAQMRDQMASGATVFPSHRQNSPQDAQRPGEPGSGGRPYPDGNLDWPGAGAVPVRTLPPWKLALLFVGVVGGALLITILIALVAR